jgi:hypothetical protein
LNLTPFSTSRRISLVSRIFRDSPAGSTRKITPSQKPAFDQAFGTFARQFASRMWGKINIMTKPPRIYTMSFANIYPLYITKAERKGRTKKEVDEIIRWLTGYSQKGLEAQLEKGTDVETFIAEAPQLNPSRALIKGVVCGVRVEDIEEPTMQGIHYLDKLIDELARGKAMEKILRKE